MPLQIIYTNAMQADIAYQPTPLSSQEYQDEVKIPQAPKKRSRGEYERDMELEIEEPCFSSPSSPQECLGKFTCPHCQTELELFLEDQQHIKWDFD